MFLKAQDNAPIIRDLGKYLEDQDWYHPTAEGREAVRLMDYYAGVWQMPWRGLPYGENAHLTYSVQGEGGQWVTRLMFTAPSQGFVPIDLDQLDARQQGDVMFLKYIRDTLKQVFRHSMPHILGKKHTQLVRFVHAGQPTHTLFHQRTAKDFGGPMAALWDCSWEGLKLLIEAEYIPLKKD